MRVVVGLGNPGRKYQRTRHNVGFLVINALANKYKIEINQYIFQSLLGRVEIAGRQVLLIKPLTYMNLVGSVLKNISQEFKVQVEDILVINDDADLELGRLKISKGSGDAGHLGVRSVIENLGSKEFPRLRIGIGRPPLNMCLQEYVLREFTSGEWEVMQEVFSRALTAVDMIILEGIEKVMINFN